MVKTAIQKALLWSTELRRACFSLPFPLPLTFSLLSVFGHCFSFSFGFSEPSSPSSCPPRDFPLCVSHDLCPSSVSHLVREGLSGLLIRSTFHTHPTKVSLPHTASYWLSFSTQSCFYYSQPSLSTALAHPDSNSF